MTTLDRNAYYCIDVKMKHGFQYTMYLPGYAVPPMKKFTEDLYWTDSVNLRDSSKEEYEKAMCLEPEISNKPAEPSEKKSKKSKTPIGFSSLDNFFQEEKPKRKKVK